MRIAWEDTFGPVLCVIPYDDEDEAVRIVNDTSFPAARVALNAAKEVIAELSVERA